MSNLAQPKSRRVPLKSVPLQDENGAGQPRPGKPLKAAPGAGRGALGDVSNHAKAAPRAPLAAVRPVPGGFRPTYEDEVDDTVMGLSPDAVDAAADAADPSSSHHTSSESADPDDWTLDVPEDAAVERIVRSYDEQHDYWDPTMVAEYSDEIFDYMAELELATMPHARYMDHQTEITHDTRRALIEWLLQVHMRYHMLPETLWICVNIVDRFLSNRVVSMAKLQLVGITAMFIAAKYEEIMAPSVDEFVFMTDGGFSREEILKGERIILESLEYNVSAYCSPYNWVRRISKADDYDVQTRTLSKFLMEITLLDGRFLRAKPSMIAAVAMYIARKMLGGDWDTHFVYYSSYSEAQLLLPTSFIVDALAGVDFEESFVYKKYSSKKYLKASFFARNWVAQNAGRMGMIFST